MSATPHPGDYEITDENWPRHPDGRRKRMGELTTAQQEAIVLGAVNRLKPEFQSIGIALSFDTRKEPVQP
jgi:hypothetical protein